MPPGPFNQDDHARGYAQMGHNPTQMYPPDPPGEEAGDNGRVWKIYRDRVLDIDDELLQGWNDALNTLLVFAGLFSAACTAFLIEVSKSLQPDWQRATSLAMFAIYVHLNSTSPPPFEVPNPLLFSPPLDARWINGLWFTSLTLSLVVSLLAILAKQWLNEFKSRMRKQASSPKAWALRHSVFKGGLERWGMDAMISVLPLLLHASLFLFLIGLGLMLLPLDGHVAGVVIGISGAVSVFYVAAGAAPVFWSDCPSVTPALRYAFSIWNYVLFPAAAGTFYFLFIALVFTPLFVLAWPFAFFGAPWPAVVLLYLNPTGVFDRCKESMDSGTFWTMGWIIPGYYWGTATPKFDQEKIFEAEEKLQREASVLTWMIRMLPAPDDVVSAFCAVRFLSVDTLFQKQEEDNPFLHEDLQRVAEDTLNGIVLRNVSSGIDDGTIANLLRACIVVSTSRPTVNKQVLNFLSKAADRHAFELRRVFKFAAQTFCDQARSGQSWYINWWRTTRLAIIASDISRPPFFRSAVAEFGSSLQNLSTDPKPCPSIEDPRLLFIAISDQFLQVASTYFDESEGYVSFTISACSVAARNFLSDRSSPPLPPNFREHLHFVSTYIFLSYQLPAADLNPIAILLLRNESHIPPLALHHILYHFQRGKLPIGVDELAWIQAAFQPPPVTSDLMDTLSVFPFTEDALHTSRLSLLQPVPFTNWNGDVITYPSPWSILFSIMPIPETTKLMVEMAHAYTVLLLALHRRGYVEPVRNMLRMLLPRGWWQLIIGCQTDTGYYLALHGKVIDSSWWSELRAELECYQEWTSHPPRVYHDVSSFIEAVERLNDCPECFSAYQVLRSPLVLPPADAGAPAGDAPEGVGAVPQVPVTSGALAGEASQDRATVSQVPMVDPVVEGSGDARPSDEPLEKVV